MPGADKPGKITPFSDGSSSLELPIYKGSIGPGSPRCILIWPQKFRARIGWHSKRRPPRQRLAAQCRSYSRRRSREVGHQGIPDESLTEWIDAKKLKQADAASEYDRHRIPVDAVESRAPKSSELNELLP